MMEINFLKQDLEKTNYVWTDTNLSLYKGDPTRRSFDKNNGYQVLFIINTCSVYTESFSPAMGKMIEQKLHSSLPSDIRSEIAVLNWIRIEINL